MAKVKYHRGHPPPGATRWVFGIVDTSTGLCYIQLVTDRSAETLLPIIQRLVLPGTEIWSDMWPAYNKLASLGYTHKKVNHSKEFKNKIDGTCTNLIENQWKCCKQKFKVIVQIF